MHSKALKALHELSALLAAIRGEQGRPLVPPFPDQSGSATTIQGAAGRVNFSFPSVVVSSFCGVTRGSGTLRLLLLGTVCLKPTDAFKRAKGAA
jgi:hypothetical protein